MSLKQWFDGVYLVGLFGMLRTGCWLLVHKDEGAVLEMPPCSSQDPCPTVEVQKIMQQLGVTTIQYLLCTHDHYDHFSRKTYRRFTNAFPQAKIYLQNGFKKRLYEPDNIYYFDEAIQLSLAGEPLFLVPAPKHSETDTFIIFRGSACTGDWELGTIWSVHDWNPFWTVPRAVRLRSIERLEKFSQEHNYRIHRIYSVHANDKREDVDFPALMASTREDKQLW